MDREEVLPHLVTHQLQDKALPTGIIRPAVHLDAGWLVDGHHVIVPVNDLDHWFRFTVKNDRQSISNTPLYSPRDDLSTSFVRRDR
jgi:predicted lipid carrier protein YhbT